MKLLDTVITIILSVGLVLLFAACHEDGDDRTVLIQPPTVDQRVECCDWDDRHYCQDFREERLGNRGFVRRNGICFDKHGRCFTDCPPERR